MPDRVDCVVIGAGAVGLAIARSLAIKKRDVIILERARAIGTGVSSRNSEVIHAGMYYPKDSLKARMCVAGNRMLREFARSHNVPHRMTGKFIVATCPSEEEKVVDIFRRGQLNGVQNMRLITGAEACASEPGLNCHAALLSEDTGIFDSHSYMLMLLGDAEAHGAIIAYESPVVGGAVGEEITLQVGGHEPTEIVANSLVIAAGLSSCAIGNTLGLRNVPEQRLYKGNYFSLSGKSPFARLIYPVPVVGGLGIHYTLDMQGRARFGPDVELVAEEEYSVNHFRQEEFYVAIERYWPGIRSRAIEPAYCGIRPKIAVGDALQNDFLIGGAELHGQRNVAALYGIESPGLTSSLAIAELVAEKLN